MVANRCALLTIKAMELDNLRIEVCEHTNRPVVQQKFGEEWVCIHDETQEEELENINNVKKQLENGKSNY